MERKLSHFLRGKQQSAQIYEEAFNCSALCVQKQISRITYSWRILQLHLGNVFRIAKETQQREEEDEPKVAERLLGE